MSILKHGLCTVPFLVVAILLIAGCSGDSSSKSASQPGASAENHTSNNTIPEGLALLSDAERAQAVKQRICPVSDEPLGSMGKPPKVTINGHDVYLCCAGCEEEMRKNPDKYLAKLKSE